MNSLVLQCIASKLETRDLCRLCQVYRELRHDRAFWRRMIRKRYSRLAREEDGDLFVLFLELHKFRQGRISLHVDFIFDGVMNVQQSYMLMQNFVRKNMPAFDVEHCLDSVSGKYVYKSKKENLYYFIFYLYPKAHMTRSEAEAEVSRVLCKTKTPKGFTIDSFSSY